MKWFKNSKNLSFVVYASSSSAATGPTQNNSTADISITDPESPDRDSS